MKNWKMAEMLGYKPITTFWEEFTKVEKKGNEEIKKVFKELYKASKVDYKYLTELAMVLNHKGWEHYNESRWLGNYYFKLFEDVNDYAMTQLKDKELDYYFEVID